MRIKIFQLKKISSRVTTKRIKQNTRTKTCSIAQEKLSSLKQSSIELNEYSEADVLKWLTWREMEKKIKTDRCEVKILGKKENFPIQKKRGKKINSVIKHKLNGD